MRSGLYLLMTMPRLDRELSWSDVAMVLAAEGEQVDDAVVRKRFERVKEKLRDLAERQGFLDG